MTVVRVLLLWTKPARRKTRSCWDGCEGSSPMLGSSSALAAVDFDEPLGLHDHATWAAAPAHSPVHGLQHLHEQLIGGLMCVELAAAPGLLRRRTS